MIRIPSIQALIATHEERHAKPVKTTRNCNQCGVEYHGRRGRGGSSAREGDLENFPYDERTGTGVRAANAHWMHGAFCSSECYAESYYEPPTPGYNW